MVFADAYMSRDACIQRREFINDYGNIVMVFVLKVQ